MLRVASVQDRHAFMLLFTFYAPRVKALMIRSGASPALAESLAHEAMYSVWRKARSYDARQSSVATFIFTIARNLRIDALRDERLKANAQQQLLGPDGFADEVRPTGTMLSAVERCDALQRALRLLTPDQMLLVRLSFFEGRSHIDIARALNIPLGTIKARLRRTMLLLLEILEDLK